MNIQYVCSGDHFISDLELPQESRPIGRWGRMHRDYLRENKPIQYNCLLLSGELWTFLADLHEQAQERLERMIDQMKTSKGITEALKASGPMAWARRIWQVWQLATGTARKPFCATGILTAPSSLPLARRSAPNESRAGARL